MSPFWEVGRFRIVPATADAASIGSVGTNAQGGNANSRLAPFEVSSFVDRKKLGAFFDLFESAGGNTVV